MYQNEVGKLHNPVSSLVSASFQTANGKKISISEKSQITVQNILREFQDNLHETDYETELKDIKARISNKSMESKFRKTANSSAQIANKTGFQAATRNRLMFEKGKQTVKHSIQANGVFIENAIEGIENKVNFKMHQGEVGKVNNLKSAQNVIKEFQGCLQEKDYETGLKDIKDRMESSAQIEKVAKTTGFQTANGKNVLMSEKTCGRPAKRISSKRKKEEEHYSRCSGKLSTGEKKSNVTVENGEECGDIGNDYANIVLSEWFLTQDNSKQFAYLQTDDTPLLALDHESNHIKISKCLVTFKHREFDCKRSNDDSMQKKNSYTCMKQHQLMNVLNECLPKILQILEVTLNKLILRMDIDSSERNMGRYREQQNQANNNTIDTDSNTSKRLRLGLNSDDWNEEEEEEAYDARRLNLAHTIIDLLNTIEAGSKTSVVRTTEVGINAFNRAKCYLFGQFEEPLMDELQISETEMALLQNQRQSLGPNPTVPYCMLAS
uniref:Uncharacterized protein n=1 Tax=Glossina morsitans morsitans TaxID=37546 RepID=A0ABK9MKX5_GLOMM